MTNLISFPRAAFLALALGAASATATFADSATTNTSTPDPAPAWSGKHHHHDKVLTEAEHAQLEKAKAAALAANPNLQNEETTLKQEKANAKSGAVGGDKTALHQQFKAFHEQLRAAELKIDPTLSTIFAKLDAAKGLHHHQT